MVGYGMRCGVGSDGVMRFGRMVMVGLRWKGFTQAQ